MCGRYTLGMPVEKLIEEFGVEEVPRQEARYNIAPTQEVVGVRQTPDGREAVSLKWGLVPSWARDTAIGSKLINARSETVSEKPAFRVAFKRRRCLIPADGFYEWARAAAGRKQPFHFRMRDGRVFAFAGLWEQWRGEGGEVIDSCTILTTVANEVLLPVHDRMPVILHPEDYGLWLGEDARKVDLLKGLLRPFPSGEMTSHAVSARVNSPTAQGAGLVAQYNSA